MGNYFAVQGGGGDFPETPSPKTGSAVSAFLSEKAGFTAEAAGLMELISVRDAVTFFTRLQGHQLWNHPKVQKGILIIVM